MLFKKNVALVDFKIKAKSILFKATWGFEKVATFSNPHVGNHQKPNF